VRPGPVSEHLLRPTEKRTCGPHLAGSDHAWITSAGSGRNATNTIIKYPDGIHPSQANQNNMEALYYRPALNVL
jgi:hypothetical protein